jgi:hypothetical protein
MGGRTKNEAKKNLKYSSCSERRDCLTVEFSNKTPYCLFHYSDPFAV